MSDEIQPALSPAEWKAKEAVRGDSRVLLGAGDPTLLIIDNPSTRDSISEHTDQRARLAIGALALAGYFTHEELEALRQMQDWVRYLDAGECPKCEGNGFGEITYVNNWVHSEHGNTPSLIWLDNRFVENE